MLKYPKVIRLKFFEDLRGKLSRVYCKSELEKKKINIPIKQINHVIVKKKGTVKGMHYQIMPYSETKIVKVIKGKIFDVLIDIRKDSKEFLKNKKFLLDSNKNDILIIPKGYAHGFQTLTDQCEIIYCHSEFFNVKKERSINPFDKYVNIKWPIQVTNVSVKDKSTKLITKTFKGYKI